MKRFLPLLVLALSNPVFAEPSAWVTQDGKPIPKSAAVQSAKGFGGLLFITQDKDWKTKWDSLPGTIPNLSAAKEVPFGQEIHILPLFANPQPDSAGAIRITADVTVKRPDGTTSVSAKGIECAVGKLEKEGGDVHLCAKAIVKFVGEGKDAPGLWNVEVRLTDHNRSLELPLKSQFRLKK